MKLSQAIEIFIISKTGEGYSPNTLMYYSLYLHRLCGFLDDPELSEITPTILTRYMAWLQTEYKPKRFNNKPGPISPATAVSNWSAIRSFFGWAAETH